MRRVPLRVLTHNGHVGIAHRNGALQWLADRLAPVHIHLLQEVTGDAGLRAVQKALPPKKWHFAPAKQTPRGSTFVVARKRRFDLLAVENANVTFGEKHERRRALAVLFDKRTRREVVVTSIHVAPLGKGFANAKPGARKRHERQVQAYASRMAEVPAGAVAIAGGDVNEQLHESASLPAGLRDRDVIAQMKRAGLVPAFRVAKQTAHLDDIFFRPDPYVQLKKRRTLNPPVQGNDHPAVLVNFRVAPVGAKGLPTFKGAPWNA